MSSPWQTSGLTLPLVGPGARFTESGPNARLQQLAACSSSSTAATTQQQQTPTFVRCGVHRMTAKGLRPTVQVLHEPMNSIAQAEKNRLPRQLFIFLNRHVLPALVHSVALQHAAIQQLRERIRTFRTRHPFPKLSNPFPRLVNPFSRLTRNRGSTEDGSMGSSMHHSLGPRPPRHALRLYEAARAAERKLDPLAAAHLFEEAVAADPRQSEWLSLAAKQWSDATYLNSHDTALATAYNQRATELSCKAVDMSPTAAHAYIARCVSRGRLALYSDNRTKVQLARDAADDAKTALSLEPHNDYAHHLMGRWHYEMAGLNAVVRTLVRLLFGTALMQGSYPDALYHYQRASELSPRTLVHRVEVGRTLSKLGRIHDAVQELEAAAQLEVEDLNSHLQKLDALELLRTLKARQGR